MSGAPTPCVWLMMMAMSSPVWVTRPSWTMSRRRPRTVSSIRAEGLVCPPIEPTSALITESVTFMEGLLSGRTGPGLSARAPSVSTAGPVLRLLLGAVHVDGPDDLLALLLLVAGFDGGARP